MALSLPDGAAWAFDARQDACQTRGADNVYVAVLRKGSASFKFI